MRNRELVWGQMDGFPCWPGIIRSSAGPSELPDCWTVEWYGQGMCSQVRQRTRGHLVEACRRSCACEQENEHRSSAVAQTLSRVWLQMSAQALQPFANFAQCFSANSFATLFSYREAIFLSLQVCVHVSVFPNIHKQHFEQKYQTDQSRCPADHQEAALRCEKKFSEGSQEREVRLKQMLDWALSGFQPTGPDGFKPAPLKNCKTSDKDLLI